MIKHKVNNVSSKEVVPDLPIGGIGRIIDAEGLSGTYVMRIFSGRTHNFAPLYVSLSEPNNTWSGPKFKIEPVAPGTKIEITVGEDK